VAFLYNFIRNKFHPIYWLYKFSYFRKILKNSFLFLNKTNKFGNFYLYLPRNINFFLNSKNYETETFNKIIEVNNKNNQDMVFIDIGANLGIYSLFFKKKYNSRVFLFEPDLNNLVALIKTKKKNNFLDFNILPLGISNKNGKEDFLNDTISGLTGSLSKTRNYPQKRMNLEEYTEILTVKLDIFIDLFEKISWIKIDIEGHEVEAIQGMIGIIEKNQPNLIIEASIDNIFKIKKLLKHINYKVEKINKGPNFIFYK
tara:strand:- start:2978 stop:3748 length:771 start_codon:yes stop_codon:yes gene_type:complete